jgi:hypothetical protein
MLFYCWSADVPTWSDCVCLAFAARASNSCLVLRSDGALCMCRAVSCDRPRTREPPPHIDAMDARVLPHWNVAYAFPRRLDVIARIAGWRNCCISTRIVMAAVAPAGSVTKPCIDNTLFSSDLLRVGQLSAQCRDAGGINKAGFHEPTRVCEPSCDRVIVHSETAPPQSAEAISPTI